MGSTVHLAWGRRGAASAAAHGHAVVIVDVLSFSTAAITACERGALVHTNVWNERAFELQGSGANEVAVRRKDCPRLGRYSMSAATLEHIPPGTRLLMPSPNGSTCATLVAKAPLALLGALVNAKACATALQNWLDNQKCEATVVACGERWREPDEEGVLRVALEDQLGAGAILSRLTTPLSPDAEVCAAAFNASRARLPELVSQCESGLELIERGYASDVQAALALDATACVPVLRGGCFESSKACDKR